MRKVALRALALGVLVGGFVPATPTARAERSADSLPINSELQLVVLAGRDIELQVLPGANDTYDTLARRVAGTATRAAAIAAWNAERPISAERWIRVPWPLVDPDYRRLLLHNLFPRDRRDGDDWVHVARKGVLATYDEGLWQVALWFTGNGANFEALMRANELSTPELSIGQEIRVPLSLLSPAFRPRRRSDDGLLFFSSDDQGPFAGYRIRAGEALYSTVIVRLTGRTAAEDVAQLAEQVRQRSDIRDLRDIPVGYTIKIPLDLLEADYLPTGHPRRREAEVARKELAEEMERRPRTEARQGLEDVLVILDAGHGGRDLGTKHNGVWEHDYVYDVTCRLKHRLETETSATVRLTLLDRETGCSPSRNDRLVANQQGTILTDPPFLAKQPGEARIAVNLRWYLANSIYRQALRDGFDSDRIIFISLHADSRHPSMRGAMVYVPGAGYRTKTYGQSNRSYNRYAEVREKRYVKLSKAQRVRSEAVSREFAGAVIEAFEDSELPVQPHQPVRGRIIRGQQRFVPAVLRGNEIPHAVLVEMVNLSNRDDAALLGSAVRRDKLSGALVDSLVKHFDGAPPRTASARRN